MKTKDIYVEVKRSANYQTYTAGMSATLDEGEDEAIAVKAVFAKCRQLTQEQIDIDATAKKR